MTRFGQGAYVGIGVKTPYATDGVAADIKLWYVVDDGHDNLQLERDVLEFETLTGDFMSTDVIKAGQRRVTGSLTLKVPLEGLQDLLRAMTGHDVSPTGVGPYVYAFVPVARDSASHYMIGTTKRHMVIELFRGGSGATSLYYQGCIATEIQLAFEQNNYVELTISFVGRGFAITAKSTPTYLGDFAKTTTGQAGAFLDLGGDTHVAKGATVTITTGLALLYDLTGIEPLGIQPEGKVLCSLTAEVEADDDTLANRLDDPETATTGRFSSGSLTLTLTANLVLVFTFDELVLAAPVEPRAAGFGQTYAALTLNAWASTHTGQAYTVTLTNNDSAYKG